MPDLLPKIIDYVLKGVATLIVGGTGYQLFDGRWFGSRIFQGVLQREQAAWLTRPPSDDLFATFTLLSLSHAWDGLPAVLVLATLVLLLALIGHVLMKPSVEGALAAVRSASPPSSRARRALGAVTRIYLTCYAGITLVLFFVLAVVFLLGDFAGGLLLLLLLIVVPSILYLIVYSKDALSGRFVDRYGYISVLLLLIVVLVMWPARFGEKVFDPTFPVLTSVVDGDACDRTQFQVGPAFVAAEGPDDVLAFRLCFNADRRVFLDFFRVDARPMKGQPQQLSIAIRTFVPPEDADPLAVLAIVRQQVEGQ